MKEHTRYRIEGYQNTGAIDRGYDASGSAETLKEAKMRARLMLTESYRQQSEASECLTYARVMRVGGGAEDDDEIVWDVKKTADNPARISKEKRVMAGDYMAVMEACEAYVAVNRPTVREPSEMYRILRPFMTAATGGNAQEAFFVVLIDTKNKVIGIPHVCTMGTLDSSPVHPREIFREAVKANAASLIMAHNHPSGDPTPSREDIEATRKLIDASRILGIRVVDHIVCGVATESTVGYMSMREKNLVSFE